jgi:hypothetical protein
MVLTPELKRLIEAIEERKRGVICEEEQKKAEQEAFQIAALVFSYRSKFNLKQRQERLARLARLQRKRRIQLNRMKRSAILEMEDIVEQAEKSQLSHGSSYGEPPKKQIKSEVEHYLVHLKQDLNRIKLK